MFWDRNIPSGQTWRTYVGKALGEARCIVVLWSSSSLESHWVHEEAEDGRVRNILIPVLLDRVIPPIGFRSIQAADLVDWDETPTADSFKQLVFDVEALLGPAPGLEEEKQVAESMRMEKEERINEAKAKRKLEEEKQLKKEAEVKRIAEEESKPRQEEEQRLKQAAETKRKMEDKERLKQEKELKQQILPQRQTGEKTIPEAQKKGRAEPWLLWVFIFSHTGFSIFISLTTIAPTGFLFLGSSLIIIVSALWSYQGKIKASTVCIFGVVAQLLVMVFMFTGDLGDTEPILIINLGIAGVFGLLALFYHKKVS